MRTRALARPNAILSETISGWIRYEDENRIESVLRLVRRQGKKPVRVWKEVGAFKSSGGSVYIGFQVLLK